MSPKRPDITDEDIGMRAFQIRKEKAVERALDRVRAGLKDDWAAFSQRDIADLSWILGEVWAYQKRSCWDDLHFSKLRPSDVVEIVTLARELKEEQRNSVETIEKVTEIILSRD
jgi:hypothetical protein